MTEENGLESALVVTTRAAARKQQETEQTVQLKEAQCADSCGKHWYSIDSYQRR